jgi:hypothetical protein
MLSCAVLDSFHEVCIVVIVISQVVQVVLELFVAVSKEIVLRLRNLLFHLELVGRYKTGRELSALGWHICF